MYCGALGLSETLSEQLTGLADRMPGPLSTFIRVAPGFEPHDAAAAGDECRRRSGQTRDPSVEVLGLFAGVMLRLTVFSTRCSSVCDHRGP